MAVTKVCCACLSFDVEMFSLTDNDIRECFQKVINDNLKMELDDEALQNVCEKCVFLMRKFVKFKDRCLKANQSLRRILTQSASITEDVLKSESEKLCSDIIVNFKYSSIIPDTKLSQVKQEDFSDPITSNLHLENMFENSVSQNDLKYARRENSQHPVESGQFDSIVQENQPCVNSVWIQSSKVEHQIVETHKNQEYLKNVIKSTQDNKFGTFRGNNMLSVKKKQFLLKSEYVEQFTLTEEQQIKEFLKKRDTFKSDIDAPFKCSHCDQGFPTKAKIEKHMPLHNESRSAWECVICKLRYSNQSRLRLHQKSHSIRYKCLKCGILMKNTKLAYQHQNGHLGIGDSYKCKACNEIFRKIQLYTRHTRTAHPTKHVCHLCGDYFKTELRLERHKKSRTNCVTSPANTYECKKCERFLQLNHWHAHMLRHAKEKEENTPTECQVCGRKTTSWTDWSDHISSKHFNKPVKRTRSMKVICNECGKTLWTKTGLSKHIHTQHTDKAIVSPLFMFKWQETCKICNKNILKANMSRHILTHTGEKPYKCDVCEKCFTQAYSRDEHARTIHSTHIPVGKRRKPFDVVLSKKMRRPGTDKITISNDTQDTCKMCNKQIVKHDIQEHILTHTGEKPYECNECGKCFTKVSSRNRHAQQMHFEKQTLAEKSDPGNISDTFTCEICSKNYSSKYCLAKHIKTHTGEKPFSCNVCQLKFCSKFSLKNHQNSHTGEKVTCDICHKQFLNKYYLRIHKQIHTDEKAFACDICDLRFRIKFNMERHKLAHSGVKNYSCELCGKTFTQATSIKPHIKTVHMKLPYPPRKSRKRNMKE